MIQRLPTYFISHGGGPWPYMDGWFREALRKLEQSLLDLRRELGNAPRAILMISGHWEESDFAISSAERPGMVYDYHGFPDYLYHIQYRAPGSPELARRVQSLLAAGGVAAQLDPTRGFDHGTFSIMKPLYPDEDMPVVQLSLKAGYDPDLHIRVGRMLAPLREEGVVIIGSGLSYHNLRTMDERAAEPSRLFDAWLQQTLVHSTADDRVRQLLAWDKAPAARMAHPREDHLIPLMVTVGAAENEPGTTIYHQSDLLGSITASSFRFGEEPGHVPASAV